MLDLAAGVCAVALNDWLNCEVSGMHTKDAAHLNIFSAKNGLVVRIGWDDMGARQQGRDNVMVFNHMEDFHRFISDHFVAPPTEKKE
ncbi:MAG: hypothetical protein GY788_07405 [bacterium]|nr:hypothetical protein [bacterium]